MTSVREIVIAYLKRNGYDGLWNRDGECGCELDCLMPCGEERIGGCIPGYKIQCSEPGTCTLVGGWHIGPKPTEIDHDRGRTFTPEQGTLCDACEAGVKRHNCMGGDCPNAGDRE